MPHRGNPHPHRYKHGKIKKPIDLEIFIKLQERVAKVDRAGFSIQFIQALLALFYWTGIRRSEVLGRGQIKYRVKSGLRIGKKHPGLLKEDFRLVRDKLFVYSVDDKVLKHGKRTSPLPLSLKLPYVPDIVELWIQAKLGKRVFPINSMAFWRICKRLDPKFTIHFFRHNRVTRLAADKDTSLAEICNWTGMDPKTVGRYLMRSGRYTEKTGDRMLKQAQEDMNQNSSGDD